MDPSTRQTSSVYSEFELEDLLRQISTQAREQEVYTIEQVERENEALRTRISSLKDATSSLYQLFCFSRDMAMQLLSLRTNVIEQRKRALDKWAAVSTEF